MTSATGTLVLPRIPELPELARLNQIDARAAGVYALSQYLQNAVFKKWNASDPVPIEFQLRRVLPEWPRADVAIDYPTATVIDGQATEMLGHNFVPTPIESTWDAYGKNTVVWKLAEIDLPFQVDFWTQSVPDREAIAASLPGLFSPGDGRSCVIVRCPEEYFCTVARLSLEQYQRVDEANSVFVGERRLMAEVRVSVDVLELRCASVLQPNLMVDVGPEVEVAPAAPAQDTVDLLIGPTDR